MLACGITVASSLAPMMAMPSSPPAASSTGPAFGDQAGRHVERQRPVGAVGRHLVDDGQPGHRRGVRIGAQRQRQGADARLQPGAGSAPGRAVASRRSDARLPAALRRAGRAAVNAPPGQHQRVAVLRRQRLVGGDHEVLLPQDAADVPVGPDADGNQHRRRAGDLAGDRVRELGKVRWSARRPFRVLCGHSSGALSHVAVAK